jgi:hypothetical protein
VLSSYEREKLLRESRCQALTLIREGTYAVFKEKWTKQLPIHDRDLQRWAIGINKRLESPIKFTASTYWLHSFKSHYGIVSRKITKFVSKSSVRDAEKISEAAQGCQDG